MRRESERGAVSESLASPVTARQLWFYGLVTLALAIQVAVDLDELLPDALATPLEQAGETWMFVLLFCTHIQFVRPRLASSKQGWLLAAVVALGYLVVAIAIHEVGLPPSLETLHEPWAAMFPLTLYFQLPRPVRWPVAYSLATVVFMVMFHEVGIVLDQSESLGALVLVPLAFDVADPRVLDPRARDRPLMMLCWCLSLVVLWLVLTVFVGEPRSNLVDPWDQVVDWTYRTSEVMPALLLVHLFFSPWISRVSRRSPITAVA